MIVAPEDSPDIVAIIPTLGTNPARLARCVDAAMRSALRHRVAILVVVNAPTYRPGSPLPTPVATVLVGMNLGWAGGLDFGRSLVSAPLVWLVQDDMVAAPECLSALRSALDSDSELAMVSPIVVGSDGLAPIGSCGGWFAPGSITATAYPSEPRDPGLIDPAQPLSFVPSRGMLVRTESWDRVGGMDPRFFPAQLSDVDFCFALTNSGLRFALVPEAIVSHGPTNRRGSTPGAFADFLLNRNHELFVSKWMPSALDAASPSANRPVTPDALSGRVDPRIPDALLVAVAQSSADTLLHLAAEHHSRLTELRSQLELTRGQLAEAQHWVEVARAENDEWRTAASGEAESGRD